MYEHNTNCVKRVAHEKGNIYMHAVYVCARVCGNFIYTLFRNRTPSGCLRWHTVTSINRYAVITQLLCAIVKHNNNWNDQLIMSLFSVTHLMYE